MRQMLERADQINGRTGTNKKRVGGRETEEDSAWNTLLLQIGSLASGTGFFCACLAHAPARRCPNQCLEQTKQPGWRRWKMRRTSFWRDGP